MTRSSSRLFSRGSQNLKTLDASNVTIDTIMENVKWEIIHIPEKPLVSPAHQPTVDVLASVIDPRLANTLVRRLNQIAPLENFRHIKRVQKKHIQAGQTQLAIILCLASDGIPNDVLELINSYQLSAFVTKVCKYAALSKEEWEEQCKLWPTSYHPPTYNIEGITGFSEEDSQSVFDFMKSAVKLAKLGDSQVVNAAVIVDPSVKQIIASACDEICSWHNPIDKTSVETSCLEQKDLAASFVNEVVSHDTQLSNGSPDEPKQLYTGVSCLYPWQWAEHQSHASSYWHPLRHAAIVAIEYSAARDRRLYPCLGSISSQSNQSGYSMSPSISSPTKRQKTSVMKVVDVKQLDSHCNGLHPDVARPYLCTGYDIYLVWEPCAMCAMALVHQRIRRIFYAFPNPNAGALGSVHRLQGEKSLNHHYAVFQVLLPGEILHGGVKL